MLKKKHVDAIYESLKKDSDKMTKDEWEAKKDAAMSRFRKDGDDNDSRGTD